MLILLLLLFFSSFIRLFHHAKFSCRHSKVFWIQTKLVRLKNSTCCLKKKKITCAQFWNHELARVSASSFLMWCVLLFFFLLEILCSCEVFTLFIFVIAREWKRMKKRCDLMVCNSCFNGKFCLMMAVYQSNQLPKIQVHSCISTWSLFSIILHWFFFLLNKRRNK